MRNRQFEIAIALTLAFILVACGASAREKTLKTTFDAVTVAEKGFVAWDAERQDEIVEHATSLDDGQAKLAAYRKNREPLAGAFITAYRSIATAMYFNNEETLKGVLLAWSMLQDELKRVTGRTWP